MTAGPGYGATDEELTAEVARLRVECRRLQRVILETTGCFTPEQVRAIVPEPEGVSSQDAPSAEGMTIAEAVRWCRANNARVRFESDGTVSVTTLWKRRRPTRGRLAGRQVRRRRAGA